MLVQCAWCGRTLGEKEGTGVSHGICEDCVRTYFTEPKRRAVQRKRTAMKATARGINPRITSALWKGATSGYYTYRAGRYETKAKRARERARAALNPRSIPGTALEIRYRRATDGKLYYHPFEGPVRMVANADGSVTLRGRHARIWADDRERGFWERYGHTRRRRSNPMARRRRRRGGDNTMWWLLGGAAAFFFWPQINQALGVATSAVSTGGQPIIPQPSQSIWYSDPYQGGGGEFFTGGLPPGASPPWRLASTTEIGSMQSGLMVGALVDAGGGLVAPNPGFLS